MARGTVSPDTPTAVGRGLRGFLSEGRRFVSALLRVKETAPMSLPEIRWVDIEASGGKAVDVIAAALA